MKFLMFIFMMLVIGALFIISNNDLALYKEGNFKEFTGLYLEWLNQVYLNIQVITGNVIGMEWVPGNFSD